MKIETFHLVESSIAALAGIGFGAYQIVNPSKPTPVTLWLATPPAADQTRSISFSERVSASPIRWSANRQTTNAVDLLRNLRTSLAMISAAYQADTPGSTSSVREAKPDSHRSNSSLLRAVNDAALTLQELELAIKSKQPRKVAEATGRASRSISKLQTTYALIPDKRDRASAGIKAVSASWTTYTSLYALPQMSASRAVDAKQIRRTKRQVAELSSRLAGLELIVAPNRPLVTEVRRIAHICS